jgi:hypothetical protein
LQSKDKKIRQTNLKMPIQVIISKIKVEHKKTQTQTTNLKVNQKLKKIKNKLKNKFSQILKVQVN